MSAGCPLRRKAAVLRSICVGWPVKPVLRSDDWFRRADNDLSMEDRCNRIASLGRAFSLLSKFC